MDCGISAVNVRVVPTVEFYVLRTHRVALSGRLVPHGSETSDELAKHVRICDAEIWTKSHFVNRDLAAYDGLAEQDKAEINRHDNLLSELLRNHVYGGVVVLLVSRRIDAYQCSEIIYTQLWIDGIDFGYAFEWRFEKLRGTTESSKVIAHYESNVPKSAIGGEIEASIDDSSLKVG